jgi:formate dehydrogenase subunit gamma
MALRSNPRARRIMAWALWSILALSVLLPSGFYALSAWMPVATAETSSNPRSDYWRDVRQGQSESAYTALNAHEAGTVLINSSGQNWRQLRNGPLATYGAMGLIAAFVGILLFYLIRGKIKLEHPRTGVKIQRWHVLERWLHWIVTAGFFLLAVTGLSLLFGRAVLIPLLGKEAFAMYAQVAHQVHHWVGPFFVFFLVIMLLVWLKNNFFTHIDVRWFAQGGGIVGKAHPSAEFMNGGEKLWYWVVFFAGLSGGDYGIDFVFTDFRSNSW